MSTIQIRASSWPELFDCAKRWEAKNLRGIRMPGSAAAHLGTSIHAGTALFDQSRLDGNPLSANDAAGAFVDTLHSTESDVVWTDDDPTPKEAERIGLTLHARYCAEIAPAREYIAVEARCESLIVQLDSEIAIELTGTTDRIRRLADGTIGISDLKSGKRRVSSKGEVDTKADGPQLAVYELLAESVIGQPITGAAEIIGLQTTKDGRVATADVPHTRELLVGTDEEPGLMQMAGMYLKSGLFPPNPKSQLCSAKFCPIHGQCKFHN